MIIDHVTTQLPQQFIIQLGRVLFEKSIRGTVATNAIDNVSTSQPFLHHLGDGIDVIL